MDSLISFGSAVKALGISDDGRYGKIGGHLICYGNPVEKDMEGDWFTPDTFFGNHDGDGAFTTINHGMPFKVNGRAVKGIEWTQDVTLAALKTQRDELGIFAETVCDLSDRFEQTVYELVKAGKFRFSSGSSAFHVRYKDGQKSGEVTRWPIVEGALTPIPCDWRGGTQVTALKSLQNAEGLLDLSDFSEESEAAIKSVWSTSKQNDLPDSSFAYIEPGGAKDSDGKTTPRSLRHFPYKDAAGKPDPAHVRNALARIPQSDVSAEAKAEALKKVRAAAKELGIDAEEAGETKPDNEKTESKKSLADILPLLTDFYPTSTTDVRHALKAIARVQQPFEWQADGARVLLEALLERLVEKDAIKSGREYSDANWNTMDGLCEQIGQIHQSMRQHLDARKPGVVMSPVAPPSIAFGMTAKSFAEELEDMELAFMEQSLRLQTILSPI